MKLNLGCGSDYLNGWINADRFEESNHHRHPCDFDIQADAHALPFATDALEHVRCRHVLEHVERPLDALREMQRILAPGGICYTEVPHPILVRNETESWHDMHLYSWTKGSLIRIHERAGFGAVEYHVDHEESQPNGHAVTATA